MKRVESHEDLLHAELRGMIARSRTQLASIVNSELTRLYWSVGERLRREVLGGERAAYGAKIVAQQGERLSAEFGRGFEARNLRRMIQFVEGFLDPSIVSTLSTKLSWSHFVELLPIPLEESRLFYAHACAESRWSVRELRQAIERKTYERTAIASSTTTGIGAALEKAKTTSDPTAGLVFKDPYFLDFLDLRQGYQESDLESAILRQMEAFILELGRGFAFVERQKRIILDGEDFYLDLLFFHRKLRRLVAVELKIGRFQAAHKGQMELYLRWLDRHERQEGEEMPIGLILCATRGKEQVELLDVQKDGIMVAEFWTELPPREELERRLHLAMNEARERLLRRGILEN